MRPLYIRPIRPCQQSFLSEMAYFMSPFQRPCMFRAGRVDVNVKGFAAVGGRFVVVVCLAREDLYFGALWWERKVISAGEMAGGRVSFSDTTGYMSKIRVQF